MGDACSHGSMRKDPSHEQRFRPATAISWGPAAFGCAPGGAHRWHGGKIGLEYWGTMNPARKRTVRLVVALSAAVMLASALIYTSFSAASPALSPSQLLHQAQPGRSSLSPPPDLPAERRCPASPPGPCRIRFVKVPR